MKLQQIDVNKTQNRFEVANRMQLRNNKARKLNYPMPKISQIFSSKKYFLKNSKKFKIQHSE